MGRTQTRLNESLIRQMSAHVFRADKWDILKETV